MTTAPIAWVAEVAARRGMRYEPEADERWLRAWEPFATLRPPLRYEQAVLSTGASGSLTLARFVCATAGAQGSPLAAAWIAIVQDERLDARACAASDLGSLFAEPAGPTVSSAQVSMRRYASSDAAFDRAFAAYAPSEEELVRAITPSLRKLVLGWRAPLHFELRKGGFVLAPVALHFDPGALDWLVDAAQLFAEKAAKRPDARRS